VSDAALLARFGRSRGHFVIELRERLLRAEQLVIHGPRGIGKSHLRESLQAECAERKVPCAFATEVHGLSAVTAALFAVYGEAADAGLPRRRLRSRVRNVAERRQGVLLLDHVTNVPSALRGFLRSLRGGPVGVAYFADVDTPAEHERLRGFHLGHVELAVPKANRGTLRRLLTQARLAGEDDGVRERLASAARGRPGFVVACVELARDDHYWNDGRLLVTTLAADAELLTRRLVARGEPMP